MQEKGVEGKNKIKERFNELAKQVTIDTSGFVNALLKKKETKKIGANGEPSDSPMKEKEESKLDNLELPEDILIGLEQDLHISPR